jgi:ABC-type nitrate/sulfonate/bicarbonate transport system substrate-binding protein
VQELGIPDYEELVVIAQADLVAENPQLVHEFMSAVARGTAAALNHPAAAVKAVQRTDEANPELSRRTTAAEVRATLPLLSRTGSMDPGKASGLIGWMHEQGLRSRRRPRCPSCPTRSEQLRVTLDGHAGPENAGILMAERRGFFRDAGLRVRVESPTDPKYPIPYMAAGRDDLGVAQQPQIIIGRDEGAQLIAIGALVPRPTEAMIWLRKSRIDGLADLEGKTIAIPGLSFQGALLRRALAHAGLGLDDVDVEEAGYELIPALLSGKADAIFGGSSNLEGAALEARGVRRLSPGRGSWGSLPS